MEEEEEEEYPVGIGRGTGGGGGERGRGRVRPTAGTILKITIRHINLTYYRLTRKRYARLKVLRNVRVPVV